MADDNLSMLLTNAGAALLARVMAGETLTFTRGAFGDSFQNGQMIFPTTDEQAQMEHLINERIELPLIKINPTGAYAEIDMQVQSAKVDNSFMISEIGLFAKIGDEQEKLYGYFNAGLKGDYMPASRSAIAKDYVYTVIVAIGNAQNVTAIINKNDYELPTASATQKGGIKIGTGLSMNGETLNVTVSGGTDYTLPTASSSTKGGIKIGTGLSMNGETLNATVTGGLSNPVEGSFSVTGSADIPVPQLWLESDSHGGWIFMSSTKERGGQIIMSGTTGGTIDASGVGYQSGIGGTIDLSGTKSGGSIDLSGDGRVNGGSIKGNVHFTDTVFFDRDFDGFLSRGNITLQTADGQSGRDIIATGKTGGTIDLSGKDSSSGGSIKGNVHFTDTVIFENGAIGISSAANFATGDEFNIFNGELRLSGQINHELNFKNGAGFSVSGAACDFYHTDISLRYKTQVTLEGSDFFLKDSRVLGTADSLVTVNFPNASVKLGSSSLPAQIDVQNANVTLNAASLRADNVTLAAHNSLAALNVNINTAFNKNVSVNNFYAAKDSFAFFDEGSTIDARKDSINITNATLAGAPHFQNGFYLGDNLITGMQVANGALKVTIDGTSFTFLPSNSTANLVLSTVPATVKGGVWMEEM